VKPRVLHLLPSPHVGGAEQIGLLLCRELRTRGYDVALFQPAPGRVGDEARRLGIPVLESHLHADPAHGRKAYRYAMAEGLKKAIDEFHPALVHSHVPITNLMANRLLPPRHIPWLATIHGSWKQFAFAPQTVSKPYLRPYLLLRHGVGDYVSTRSAVRVVAVADYVRKDLDTIGVPSKKIVVVHNGLPPLTEKFSAEAVRTKLEVPRDALLLGSVGYMAPVKGFDLLIEAFARLADRHPQLHLLIAGGDVMGDSSVRENLQRRIDLYGLRDRARLLGKLDNTSEFLSALDIFCLASRTEGLPLTLIEAMQCGKASVVTSEGGCVEAARPGREALVFQSKNCESLVRKLEVLIRDEALRASLARAASDRAASYLTLSRCAAEYEHLYQSILTT
jgi:glycosyltransferase involved in cell wall biosynthesis